MYDLDENGNARGLSKVYDRAGQRVRLTLPRRTRVILRPKPSTKKAPVGPRQDPSPEPKAPEEWKNQFIAIIEVYCYTVERIVKFICTYVAALASCEETNKDLIEDKMKVSTLHHRITHLWWTVCWKLKAQVQSDNLIVVPQSHLNQVCRYSISSMGSEDTGDLT